MQRLENSLLLCVVLFLVAICAAQDACVFQASYLVSMQQVQNCANQIAFSNTIAQDTMSSLTKTIGFYAFKDIAVQSPEPRISSVNIVQDLNNVLTMQFSNDYQFHMHLVKVFRALNDGHTIYLGPKCYENLKLVMPFQIASYVTAQQQRIKIIGINSNVAAYLQSTYGLDVTPFVNAEILSIDGVPAVTTVRNFADTMVGIYKDLGTRFNMAVENFFMTRSMNRFDFPVANVTFELKRATGEVSTILVPWVGFSSANYTSVAQFNASCYVTSMVQEQDAMVENEFELSAPVFARYQEQPNAAIQLLAGDKVAFYKLDDQTGVVKIQDFGPNSIAQFARDFQTSLFMAKLYRLPRLIVDLINNGGGEECLGYALVKYLYPASFSENYETLFANSDMMQTDLGIALATAAANNVSADDTIWNPGHWRSAHGMVYKDATWYTNGLLHTRGGLTSTYTSVIKENYCGSFFEGFLFGDVQNYTPDNIILLSNGRCGSTCALFSRHLQESRKAKTVVVGGILGEQQQIAQVPGGQVYEFTEILDDIVRYKLTDLPIAPKPLPTFSRFRFAIREAYPWNQNNMLSIPLEFFFEASDFRIPYTEQSAVNVQLVWQDAAALFDTCASWETRACAVTSGNGFQVCINGKYDTQCNVTSCNMGTYLDIKSGCVACATGTQKNTTGIESCVACSNMPAHAAYSGTGAITTCPYTCISGYSALGNICESDEDVKIHVIWLGLLIALSSLLIVVLLIMSIVMVAILRKYLQASRSNNDEASALIAA